MRRTRAFANILSHAALNAAEKLDRILDALAARALHATGATSVAIGLIREDKVVCRAMAGLPFSKVGDPINGETGLTGMAIRRQMSQWSNDTDRTRESTLKLAGISEFDPSLLCPSTTGMRSLASPQFFRLTRMPFLWLMLTGSRDWRKRSQKPLNTQWTALHPEAARL